jgi:2,4-dienoyl-CoA reductase-like NADH-dependent reductase (Old Yellow Enzyme family)
LVHADGQTDSTNAEWRPLAPSAIQVAQFSEIPAELTKDEISDDGNDYIAMARPLIREPGLANRWLQGDRGPATCISRNSCFNPGLEEGGIYCVIEKKEREKAAKS